MKTKFFLLIGIFTIALTACEGDDNNGNDPTKPLDDAQISFTKMANCPVATEMKSTVYNGLIYYASQSSDDFLSYNPKNNEWKTLAQTPNQINSSNKNFFAWMDKLYCHLIGGQTEEAYIYQPETDNWIKTDQITPPSSRGMTCNIGGKLFLFYNSSKCKVYHFDMQKWEDLESTDFGSCNNFCQINNIAYGIAGSDIYQFDPETYITTRKVTLPNISGTLAVSLCNQQQMIYTQSQGTYYGPKAKVGIYTPSTNEYSEISNVEIPMMINKLTYFDGRFFIGPNNAAFYELKIK